LSFANAYCPFVWSCRKGLNLKKKPLLIIVLFLFLLIASSACQLNSPKPSAKPTSDSTEEIKPLTLLSYLEESKLDKTEHIEFTHPQTKQQIVISDQVTIQAVVDLLKSASESCETEMKSTEEGLLVVFSIRTGEVENAVSLDFYPDENRIMMDSIPTGYWPVKIYGSYSVCFDFGSKLYKALGL
jgi:hypothetical protein